MGVRLAGYLRMMQDARCMMQYVCGFLLVSSPDPSAGGGPSPANKLPYAAHKLSAKYLKLRQKLEEVASRRDYYDRLYYEALAELESYKRRIDFIDFSTI